MSNCVICGSAFTNKNPRTKTCSPACSKTYNAQLSRQWEIDHPEETRLRHQINDVKYRERRRIYSHEHQQENNEYRRRKRAEAKQASKPNYASL
jgi:hypothetical protein